MQPGWSLRNPGGTLIIAMLCAGMQFVIFHLFRDAGASRDEFKISCHPDDRRDL